MKAEMRGQEGYRSCDEDSKSLGPVMLKVRWRRHQQGRQRMSLGRRIWPTVESPFPPVNMSDAASKAIRENQRRGMSYQPLLKAF